MPCPRQRGPPTIRSCGMNQNPGGDEPQRVQRTQRASDPNLGGRGGAPHVWSSIRRNWNPESSICHSIGNPLLGAALQISRSILVREQSSRFPSRRDASGKSTRSTGTPRPRRSAGWAAALKSVLGVSETLASWFSRGRRPWAQWHSGSVGPTFEPPIYDWEVVY